MRKQFKSGGGLEAFEDPQHPGNGPEYHTGRRCITPGCGKDAGTLWSPHWCFECNVERIKRISSSLELIVARMRCPFSMPKGGAK